MIGLTYIRKAHNITMQELANTLKVSKQTISKWESRKKPITNERLRQLEEIFRLASNFYSNELTHEEKLAVLKSRVYEESLLEEKTEIGDTKEIKNVLRRIENISIAKDSADSEVNSIVYLNTLAEILEKESLTERKILLILLELRNKKIKYDSSGFYNRHEFSREKGKLFDQMRYLVTRFEAEWLK